ncbi:MAG TPA: hypothetical protein VGD94_23240 [Vicinamibacterales bacterium]
MTEQQERALTAGLKALAASTRQASASPAIESAVLGEMRRAVQSRRVVTNRAWIPLAAALVLTSGAGAWFAHTSSVRVATTIRPAGFVAIPGTAAMPPVESGAIVRVAVPVAELPSYGIAILPELIDGTVEADFFIAQDGQARAIRLVNTTFSSRSTP